MRQMVLIVLLLVLTLILTLSQTGYARVGGVCSNCHTMHNSQDGTSMRYAQDATPISGTGVGECADCHAQQRAALLRMNCVACHAQNPNGTSNRISIGASLIPQVALGTGSAHLAGGNFSYVFGGNDAKGHNVHGFGATINQYDLGNLPPGYDAAFDPSTGKYDPFNDQGQIFCAGQNGCHGNRDEVSPIGAIKGAHHANDAVLKFGTINAASQGATVGTSYRYLYKVKGGEEANWEGLNPSSTVHNEYAGMAYSSRTGQNWTTISTVSEFCAECHGDFHSAIGSASPWIRHPVDILLPNTGEYANYTTYDVVVPVARLESNIPNAPSATVQNISYVMCLTCHRPHASNYADGLRWDYPNTTGGCKRCHTQK